uniref:Uncharacterized protein n=1 Tax=Acrobeloides nanus TaxID=290746 RepID=A0A914C5I9_9BILA
MSPRSRLNAVKPLEHYVEPSEISTLEVTSSSLTAKKIWNINLSADVATIADPIRFKNAIKGDAVYNLLTNTKIVGRPEL